jgi:phosphate-selective porin OprO and OprP
MARWRTAIVAGGLVLSSGAIAQTAPNVDQLESQLKAMQEQMRVLQQRVEEAKAQAAAAQWAASQSVAAAKAKESKHDDLDLKVKWKGAPEFSSKDGKFKMKVRGRIETDYEAIDQDTAITGRPDVSAVEIRRARIGVEGLLYGDIKYKFEVDFAHDETAIKDAYLEYLGLMQDLGLRVGHFKTFNSLEHLTSDRFITFMERAAFIDAYELDRQLGAGVIFAKEHYTLAAGVFGPHAEDDTTWLNNVRAGAARVTVAPINNEDHTRVVHLGASWRTRHGAEDARANPVPANDQLFRYRARGADFHLADRFIATPAIFDEDTFWGAEGAVVLGPWSVQGEFGQLHADLASGFVGASPTYNGWYVETSYFLTGEHRNYEEGEFGRPKVLRPVFAGGPGAWQIAGKYDVLSLSDKATLIATCTMCGNQNTWLIGVNWWLNDYVRFMFDYNESTITGGFMNGANVNDGAKIKGFGTRAQVDW